MEYFLGLISITSAGYLLKNISNYINYKKFIENGYINDYHLIEGKCKSKNNLSSFVSEFYTNLQNNIIIKNLSIYVGKEKIGYNTVIIPSGKSFIHIPQPYTYTDWTNVHNKLYWVDDLMLNNIKLQMSKIKEILPSNIKILRTKNIDDKQKLYKMFNEKNIVFKQGEKIKVTESIIQNCEEMCAFGNYITNKEFQPQLIGIKKDIIKEVRKNHCNIRFGRLFFFGTIFFTSTTILINKFYSKKKLI